MLEAEAAALWKPTCIADMAIFLVGNAKALGRGKEQYLNVKESVLG